MVSVAELMAAFRDVEETRPGICDELIRKFVAHIKTLSPPLPPPSSSTDTKPVRHKSKGGGASNSGSGHT